MLKKTNRLGKVEPSKSELFKTEFFNFKVSESSQKEPRFAFVVSKKVSKSAVLRNKTKRALAKLIESNLDKIKPNKNIIIFAKKILDVKTAESATDSILEAFKRAKITK